MITAQEVITRIEQAIQREIDISQDDLVDSINSYEVGYLEGLDKADSIIRSIVYEYESILDSAELEYNL